MPLPERVVKKDSSSLGIIFMIGTIILLHTIFFKYIYRKSVNKDINLRFTQKRIKEIFDFEILKLEDENVSRIEIIISLDDIAQSLYCLKFEGTIDQDSREYLKIYSDENPEFLDEVNFYSELIKNIKFAAYTPTGDEIDKALLIIKRVFDCLVNIGIEARREH